MTRSKQKAVKAMANSKKKVCQAAARSKQKLTVASARSKKKTIRAVKVCFGCVQSEGDDNAPASLSSTNCDTGDSKLNEIEEEDTFSDLFISETENEINERKMQNDVHSDVAGAKQYLSGPRVLTPYPTLTNLNRISGAEGMEMLEDAIDCGSRDFMHSHNTHDDNVKCGSENHSENRTQHKTVHHSINAPMHVDENGEAMLNLSNSIGCYRVSSDDVVQIRCDKDSPSDLLNSGRYCYDTVTEKCSCDEALMAQPTVFAKDFHLIKKIGSGGMGTVWKADVSSRLFKFGSFSAESPVALKVIPIQQNSNFHIDEEVSIHAAMSVHPTVARHLHAHQEDGFMFISMELVDGPSLEKFLEFAGPLGELNALRVMRSVFGLLSFMHSQRCAHLDMKPANIVACASPKFGEVFPPVKVIDFGLSVRFDEFLGVYKRKCTSRGGTIGYAAPEVMDWDAEYAAAHADVWSAGITLHILLNGSLPFLSDSHAETVEGMEDIQNFIDSEDWSGVDPRTVSIMKNCLNCKADGRPSAFQSLQAVERILFDLGSTA